MERYRMIHFERTIKSVASTHAVVILAIVLRTTHDTYSEM